MERQSKTAAGKVPEKILATAKSLFVEQGYKKTTIRQIVEKSGVLTGSIYHFYKNKEDIFKALVLLVMNQSITLINRHFKQESPVFRYAAMNAVAMKAVEINEFVRESYYEGYTSNSIFEQIVKHTSEISEIMFKELNPGYGREDYYIRNMLIRGAVRSCVAKFYFEEKISTQKCSDMLIKMALLLFEVSESEIEEILKRLDRLDSRLTDIATQLIEASVNI